MSSSNSEKEKEKEIEKIKKEKRRNVVMTGGSGGIGLNAVQRIVASKKVRVLVGVRKDRGTMPKQVERLTLDLSSLKSVYKFSVSVKEALDGQPIDILVLNAGTTSQKLTDLSADGFLITFGVNHLAHYYLVRLLLPNMARGGRIVITTSDTHDPKVLSMAGGPTSLDLDLLKGMAYGKSKDIKAMKVYSFSKACNLLMARYLADKDQFCIGQDLQVVAYNPGLTLGTGLGGTRPTGTKLSFKQKVASGLLKGASVFNKAMYPNDVPTAGKALARLILGKAKPPKKKIYASMVKGKLTFPSPSLLVQDDEAVIFLWDESENLLGKKFVKKLPTIILKKTSEIESNEKENEKINSDSSTQSEKN
ncbi:retinol dehydrogenase [Anaeramoeba flamelloides]|uniref:Retinol dehydrogenase n=1 Tax=Anaeramoeba flamelloides TaxID=1746091 RepID=A0AAV8AGW6_9EUKA|nr:retinol dehydrogenase [Anaeramoeba flamelloides]